MLQRTFLSSLAFGLLLLICMVIANAHDESVVNADEASLIRGGCFKIGSVTRCSDDHTCCNAVNGHWQQQGTGGTQDFDCSQDTACGDNGTCTCGYYNTCEIKNCSSS